MKKIKSCSMENQPEYFYEIEYNGDVIAKCKMLSTLENEEWLREKTPLRQQYKAVSLSVVEWAFVDENEKPLPIDVHSIDKIIAPEYVVTMSNAVFEKIKSWQENKESVLKN